MGPADDQEQFYLQQDYEGPGTVPGDDGGPFKPAGKGSELSGGGKSDRHYSRWKECSAGCVCGGRRRPYL